MNLHDIIDKSFLHYLNTHQHTVEFRHTGTEFEYRWRDQLDHTWTRLSEYDHNYYQHNYNRWLENEPT